MNELTPIRKEAIPVILKIISDAELTITQFIGRRVKLEIDIEPEQIMTQHDFKKMQLQKEVCVAFGLSWKEMIAKNRSRNKVEARRVYCYLGYRVLKITSMELAMDLDRDHSSVLHLSKSAVNLMQISDPIAIIINDIKKKIQ